MSPALLASLASLADLEAKHPRIARSVRVDNADLAPRANASEEVVKGWVKYLTLEIRNRHTNERNNRTRDARNLALANG